MRFENTIINNIVMLSRQPVLYPSSSPVRRGRIAECGFFFRFYAKLTRLLDVFNNYSSNNSTTVKVKRFGRRFDIQPKRAPGETD